MPQQKIDKTMSERQRRIFDFIKSNQTGVLASVDPNGDPHATVIYHTIDKHDFSISFLTKDHTKKYDNIIRNNHVVLVIYDASTQTVAQVIGKAKEIKNHDEINKIAASINAASLAETKYDVVPIAKLKAGNYTAFRIQPVQIRMAIYSQPRSGDYQDLFETVESFELKTDY
ncbi:MAG: pyridoxamine 5'-phosphate oxidase family protein [Candidatus Saccharimonadales bacterium]